MKNWSGYLQWNPSEILYPQTEEEISQIVKRAIQENKKVRTIGSGHSFTPLSKTNDLLVSLDKFQGIISQNKETQQVTVKAGTKLDRLNDLLAKEGLALPNMGDINVQSIAGAISTGTHGTGTAFGNMSTQVVKIKFINGLGEVVTCSEKEQQDVFKAAQISLGSFGIISAITLQCVPAYTLELHMRPESLQSVLDNLQTLNETNRNFEFFWFPNTPSVVTKRSNLTDKTPDGSSFKNYFQEIVLENYAFKLLAEMTYRFPSTTRRISKFAANTVDTHSKINESHKVFSTPRMVRFNEMEYNVPIEAYLDVKKELVNWVNKNNYDIMFPIENRFVKGDDIFLSPAYERDSAYIAVHAYSKKDFKPFFQAMETIFKAHEGRPHWGKMHTFTTEDIISRYPKFGQFINIRAQQDPQEIFLSPYLKTLFLGVPNNTNTNENLPTL